MSCPYSNFPLGKVSLLFIKASLIEKCAPGTHVSNKMLVFPTSRAVYKLQAMLTARLVGNTNFPGLSHFCSSLVHHYSSCLCFTKMNGPTEVSAKTKLGEGDSVVQSNGDEILPFEWISLTLIIDLLKWDAPSGFRKNLDFVATNILLWCKSFW